MDARHPMLSEALELLQAHSFPIRPAGAKVPE